MFHVRLEAQSTLPALANSVPTDAKAAKAFADAAKLEADHKFAPAMDGYRHVDAQTANHCVACELRAYALALQLQDYKAAREETAMLLTHVTSAEDKAEVHRMAGEAYLTEGGYRIFEEPFKAADVEFQAALELQPGKPDYLYLDGVALAHLHRYDQAKERFEHFVRASQDDDVRFSRAKLFVAQPDLARKRVVPDFRFITADGKIVSMKSLQGKVVLLDFWATWCGPCVKYLPHLKELVKEFEGQPLVVISISLDNDEKTWKYFLAHNDMTWTQYRDGGFDGSLASRFGIKAIPTTFSIDVNGFVQDQQVGEGDIEGNLKKLVKQAQDAAAAKTVAEAR